MKTVLTKQELAERWSITPKTIDEYRRDGILSEMKIPAIRFPITYIEELEGVKLTKFSPLEREKIEKELVRLKELERENKELRAILSNVLLASSQVISVDPA